MKNKGTFSGKQVADADSVKYDNKLAKIVKQIAACNKTKSGKSIRQSLGITSRLQ